MWPSIFHTDNYLWCFSFLWKMSHWLGNGPGIRSWVPVALDILKAHSRLKDDSHNQPMCERMCEGAQPCYSHTTCFNVTPDLFLCRCNTAAKLKQPVNGGGNSHRKTHGMSAAGLKIYWKCKKQTTPYFLSSVACFHITLISTHVNRPRHITVQWAWGDSNATHVLSGRSTKPVSI